MEPHACIALWATRDGRPPSPCTTRRRVCTRYGRRWRRCSDCSPNNCAWSPRTSAAASAPKAPRTPTTCWYFLPRNVLEGRPVKLALTRQQMFALVGYRTQTIQRMRLGADTDGRLTAIVHEVGRADLRRQGIRRADGGHLTQDVRGAEPADHRTGWRRSTCRCRSGCGRPVSARHVRRRGRDGRARGGLRRRPDRTARPQRRRGRPGDRQAVVAAGTSWSACGSARNASAGPTAIRMPAETHCRRMVHRDRRRHRRPTLGW